MPKKRISPAARLLLLLPLALGSCAATLRVSGTAPAQDNDGTCESPILIPSEAGLVTIHIRYSGTQAGAIDSLVTRGDPFSFSRSVSPGTYTVRAWASDAGGASCSTTITVRVKARSDKPTLSKE